MDPALFGQAIVNGLMKGGIYALLACGATMIYAVSKIFNFAHGDFMAIGLYLAVAVSSAWQMEPYVSMLIGIPLLFALGCLLFRYIFRRVLKAYFLMTIQLTLGMIFVIQAALDILFKADARSVGTALSSVIFHIGPISIWLPLLIGLIVAVIVLGGLFWAMANTDSGRSVRAIIQNPVAAGLAGIDVSRVQTYVFGLGMALAALAAGLLAPSLTITTTMGTHLTLLAFIIMMLGGLGNFLGALLGALIIGLAESFAGIYIGGTMSKIVPFCIFMIILLFKREGILGGRG